LMSKLVFAWLCPFQIGLIRTLQFIDIYIYIYMERTCYNDNKKEVGVCGLEIYNIYTLLPTLTSALLLSVSSVVKVDNTRTLLRKGNLMILGETNGRSPWAKQIITANNNCRDLIKSGGFRMAWNLATHFLASTITSTIYWY
jgi:hypothetical protein